MNTRETFMKGILIPAEGEKMFVERLSKRITNKLVAELLIMLEEIESNNKNCTKIEWWDFDVDKMEVFGEFEHGVKFREKLILGGE